jgi:hypothetical protein
MDEDLGREIDWDGRGIYGEGGMKREEDGVGKASGWIRREGEMDGEMDGEAKKKRLLLLQFHS